MRWPRRWRDRAGLLVVAVVVTAALVGPWLVADPDRMGGAGFLPPGPGRPLGTDGLGRDVWLRVVSGGSGLLVIAGLATLAAMVVGILVGWVVTAGHPVGRILAAGLNVLLVIPSMLTMLVLIFGLGSGVATLVLIMAVASVPFVARYTRAVTAPVLASDYVLASRAAGDSWPRVLVRDVWPNLAAPLLTDAGARFIGALYLVAAAGFLGFSPLGGDGDWASMVQAGLPGLRLNPWASLAPALAIAAVTIPANLLVDRAARRGAA